MSKQFAFVPRSVVAQTKVKSVSKSATTSCYVQGSHAQSSASGDVTTELDVQVKKESSEQRWPSSDEPVCITCGKYGEYICDQTDEDVCSIECKQRHLQNVETSAHIQDDQQFNSTLRGEDATDSFDKHYTKAIAPLSLNPNTNISADRMRLYREKLDISIEGNKLPDLVSDFNLCGLSELILQNLHDNGYMTPTAVQMQVIPIILDDNDVMVTATTGCGKTASFLIPLVHKISKCLGVLSPSHEFCKYPIALILSPTRELCMQIEEQTKQICRGIPNMKTSFLIGGQPLPQQLHRLRHKIQFVIGTPGRINDIIDNHIDCLKLHQIKMVVLDEVDVMLQMGFQKQIQMILDVIPNKPQYLMFSATIPPSIVNLSKTILINPLYVSVGPSGLPNKHVRQLVLWVQDVSKKKKLFSIINDGKHYLPPAVVFVESKIGADMLCEAITEKFDLNCASIHSDKKQDSRTEILQQFLAGVYDILVATNLMARGIDLLNVKQVIIFDMPRSIDEYVHQVGRAGRLETNGFAIAFINNSSKNLFHELKQLFEITQTKLPDEVLHSPHLKFLEESLMKKLKEGKIKRKEIRNKEVNPQNLLEILTKRKRK